MVRDDPLADLAGNEVSVAEAGKDKTRVSCGPKLCKERKQDALDRRGQRDGLVAALVAVVEGIDRRLQVVAPVVRQESCQLRTHKSAERDQSTHVSPLSSTSKT